MTYVPAAPEFERLPWLNDTKPAVRTKSQTSLVLWSGLAALLVAGGSYWLGLTGSADSGFASAGFGDGASTATISLPEPYSSASSISSQEMAAPPALPQVEPVKAPPPVKIAGAPRSAEVAGTQDSGADRPMVGNSRAAEAREAARASSSPPAPAPAPAPAAAEDAQAVTEQVQPRTGPPERWPAEQSAGAAGRMVRIGTFGTRLQAKRGWRAIVKVYPGMNSLKAVVVPQPSMRDGRTYYRLQFGTTSQAHSAILCQRMRAVGQSCIVIGSPSGVGG